MMKQYYKRCDSPYGITRSVPLDFWPNLGRNVWRFFVRNECKNAALTALVLLGCVLTYAWMIGRI